MAKADGEANKNNKGRKYYSLSSKTVKFTVICCVIFGLVALTVGLGLYSKVLTDQYIRHAYDIAKSVSTSVRRGADSVSLSEQVMEIYNSLTEEQRRKVGTEEYRGYFSGIDISRGGVHSVLTHMLYSYCNTDDIDFVYLAMYDRENSAIVYIVDPDPGEPMQPGDWETVDKNETVKFLDGDGSGMTYHISYTNDYGWLCTAGVPLRADDGRTVAFLLADVSIGKVIAGIMNYALMMIFALAVVTAFVAWFMTRHIGRTIVKPINSIAEAAEEYVRGKQAGETNTESFSKLDIHTGDELENLSRIMGDMERDLAEHEQRIVKISADKERISTELQMAMRIQTGVLPHIFPPYPDRAEFDLYATMTPAKEVGGDFYDFFLIDSDHLCMVMADVSGKGIPAALFMMVSKVIIQSCAMLGRGAAEILDKTNEAICSNNQLGMFVTTWVGILEISTGKITAANAGHEYPVLKRGSGGFEMFKDPHGFVIGGLKDFEYKEYELMLSPGDRLFLYTDGVPEATDSNEEIFGTSRMLKALNEAPAAPLKDTVEHVRSAVNEFVGDAEQFDDLTMLCFEYKGK